MEYNAVTIVSAARGMPALRQVLSQLPSTFAAPIVCLAQSSERTLQELRSITRLRVEWARSGMPLDKGTVYVAPPSSSLVWRPDGTLSVTATSIDSTAQAPVDHFLESTSRVHGEAGICLILAGVDGDGVTGARALKKAGGTVLVLDRATAQFWGLAEPIVRAGAFDRVLTVAEAADALRACFRGRDLLRCAEIQIELGALLETALALSGTRMGHVSGRTGDARLKVLVHRGLGTHFLERFDRVPVDADTGAGRALLHQCRVVVPDVMVDADYAPRREDALLCGFRAVHATPIPPSARKGARGVLTTLFPQAHTVSAHEARDMDSLAQQAMRLVVAMT